MRRIETLARFGAENTRRVVIESQFQSVGSRSINVSIGRATRAAMAMAGLR
jgi:hypothetical protein